ncbi:hypothetical protein KC367_g369 [Hortaea werneckii]|nr:hypothetical protein KC367_g369 [Hortaea werneckii]
MSSNFCAHPPPPYSPSDTCFAALMAMFRHEDNMHPDAASPTSTSFPPSSATRDIPITLTPSADSSDLRHLSLADRIIIGRASRSEIKNLQASPTNALFDCPVVSRAHAVIHFHPTRDYDEQVTITDLKSMHGTAVNGQRLLSHAPHILRSGDTIKLGDRVVRGPDHHDGIQIIFRRQPLPPILGAGTYAVPMDESASDVESTFSEQDDFSSAQTTPEQDKFRFGSQLQPPIGLDAAGALHRNDEQQHESDHIPQVVKDTYAESDSDSQEDGSSSQVYDAHDSEDELDVSPSKIDIYNDLMSTMAQHPESDNGLEDDDDAGQDEHEYDDGDEHDELDYDGDHVDDDYPDEPPEEYSTRLSPELGSAAVEETSASWPATRQIPLEPLLAPHFLPSYSFPGITPSASKNAGDKIVSLLGPTLPNGNIPTPPAPEVVPTAPKGRISISDIVEEPTSKEASTAPASIPRDPETNNTADKAGPTTTTGTKRKADVLSQNDSALATGVPASSPAPNTEQQGQPPHLPTAVEIAETQPESPDVVYVYDFTPPAAKKAKKSHALSPKQQQQQQQQQQQKKKGSSVGKQVAKYAGLYLAGGLSAVAFLASPLAQKALDAL